LFAVRRGKVDIEANFVAVEPEIDDYAGGAGSFPFSNRQNAGSSGDAGRGDRMFAFGGTDKHNLAAHRLFGGGDVADDERMTIYCPAGNRILQRTAERVATGNADYKWFIRVLKRGGRPFYEFGEIVDEGGLHLIFVGGLFWCAGKTVCQRQAETKHGGAAGRIADGTQLLHVILAKALRSASVRRT